MEESTRTTRISEPHTLQGAKAPGRSLRNSLIGDPLLSITSSCFERFLNELPILMQRSIASAKFCDCCKRQEHSEPRATGKTEPPPFQFIGQDCLSCFCKLCRKRKLSPSISST